MALHLRLWPLNLFCGLIASFIFPQLVLSDELTKNKLLVELPAYSCARIFSASDLEVAVGLLTQAYHKQLVDPIKAETSKEGTTLKGVTQADSGVATVLLLQDYRERIAFGELGPMQMPSPIIKEVFVQIDKKDSKYIVGKKPELLPSIRAIEIENKAEINKLVLRYFEKLIHFIEGLDQKEFALAVKDSPELQDSSQLLEFYKEFYDLLKKDKISKITETYLKQLTRSSEKKITLQDFTLELMTRWIEESGNYEQLKVFDPDDLNRSWIGKRTLGFKRFWSKLKERQKQGFDKEVWEKSGPRMLRWAIGTGIHLTIFTILLTQTTAPEIVLYNQEISSIQTLIDQGRPDVRYVGRSTIHWSDNDLIDESLRWRNTVGRSKELIVSKISTQESIPPSVFSALRAESSSSVRREIESIRIPQLKEAIRKGDEVEINEKRTEFIDSLSRYWMALLTNDPILFGSQSTPEDLRGELKRISDWIVKFDDASFRQAFVTETNRRMQAERAAMIELLGEIAKKK